MKTEIRQNRRNTRKRTIATLIACCHFSAPVAGQAAYTPSEMETNAQIQWLLAKSGCAVGAVDGLLHSSHGQSQTENCLQQNGIAIKMDPKRMVNELNRKASVTPYQALPIDVMRQALAGVDARIGNRELKPSLYDRTRAAREGLANLAVSDSFPFLLLGITSSDDDIAAWSETVFKNDPSYHHVPQALWQIVQGEGEVSPGISRFFRTLDRREHGEHTRQLIKFYLADNNHPDRNRDNDRDLLAEMIYKLWKGEHKALEVLVRILLDASPDPGKSTNARQLNRTETFAILRRFGNDVISPLAKVYSDASRRSENGKEATLLSEFLIASKQPREVIKQAARLMDGSHDPELARLINRVIQTHYEPDTGKPSCK